MSQSVPPPTRPHLAVEQVQTVMVGNTHGDGFHCFLVLVGGQLNE